MVNFLWAAFVYCIYTCLFWLVGTTKLYSNHMPERQIHIGIINSYTNLNKSVTYFHWKILAPAGIWTRDLPGTKPICSQLSYPGLNFFSRHYYIFAFFEVWKPNWVPRTASPVLVWTLSWIKLGLSFFPNTQPSKVRDFLKK